MTRVADLHLHTRHSDGTWTPAELVERARAEDLACIALTDHDTVAGVPEMMPLCAAADIEFIPGVELTANLGEREIHVLGYFIRHDDPEFSRQLDYFQRGRSQRVVDMLAKLQTAGVDLQMADVAALADPGSSLGRLHVARAMLNKGLIRQIDEAFYRYIGKGKPAFVPKIRISVADAAELIHHVGGVAILAHPGIAHLESHFDEVLTAGLDGIEVWHSRHTVAQCRRYLEFTQTCGCLATGGSDCHGMAKGHVLIGSVKLDYSYVERLKEFHARSLSKVS